MPDTETQELHRHPIAVVAERTRLSPDVLRVWERRYYGVKPGRGRGGQRLYSDADVEKLRLLHKATAAGRSIGQIAHLPVEELRSMVNEDAEARELVTESVRSAKSAVDYAGEYLTPAMSATVALDPNKLESVLKRASTVLSLTEFLENVVTPFCRGVGDAWHQGRVTPAQEHLATSVVHRVVSSAITSLTSPERAPIIVVATPRGERHELGAMLAAASASLEGWRVIYLGADLPAEEIAATAKRTGASAVGVSAVYLGNRISLLAELTALRAALPAAMPLIAGGNASVQVAADLESIGITVARNVVGLRSALANAAPRAMVG